MTETIVRKSQTGEPGNKGEFGSKANSESGVELASSEPRGRQTPEQIAQDVYWGISDFPVNPRGSDLRRIMADAARAGQREPQFKPAGEPDEFRDAWSKLDGLENEYVAAFDGVIRGVRYSLNPDQAKHILAYLSETSE